MWTKRRRNREKQRSRNLYVNIMWENRAQAFYCLSGSLVTLYALSAVKIEMSVHTVHCARFNALINF